ncbi:hypothetical protein V6N12_000627 [Hibiscus sabdariffa]|uniref:Uncharacterized protein n=1 Tax=Hibiscus sabdariffa TaxID=183260 RepID=A0ABR2B973_9ROSI
MFSNYFLLFISENLFNPISKAIQSLREHLPIAQMREILEAISHDSSGSDASVAIKWMIRSTKLTSVTNLLVPTAASLSRETKGEVR